MRDINVLHLLLNTSRLFCLIVRFIVILYIPVLCLWRAGRKVLVTPKQSSDAICDSDLDLCLDAKNGTKKDDDTRSRCKRSRRNSGRKTSPRIRRTFQRVLPVVHGGRVCWRAATQVSSSYMVIHMMIWDCIHVVFIRYFEVFANICQIRRLTRRLRSGCLRSTARRATPPPVHGKNSSRARRKHRCRECGRRRT